MQHHVKASFSSPAFHFPTQQIITNQHISLHYYTYQPTLHQLSSSNQPTPLLPNPTNKPPSSRPSQHRYTSPPPHSRLTPLPPLFVFSHSLSHRQPPPDFWPYLPRRGLRWVVRWVWAWGLVLGPGFSLKFEGVEGWGFCWGRGGGGGGGG